MAAATGLGSVAAQPQAKRPRLRTQWGPFSVSGAVGFSAEAYGAAGGVARRAPMSAQTYASVSASGLGFSYGLNLLLSTQQSQFRQSYNYAGLDLRYKWARLAGGQITPSLSKYSLGGTAVRGALVELTPGPLVLTALGGRTQRAVNGVPDLREAVYAQWLYAGRIGVGREEGPHFHLIGLVARDDTSSVTAPGDVRPAENFSLTPDVGLVLYAGRIRLRAQTTVSAFTLNTHTNALDLAGAGLKLPDWAGLVFTPREGTRLDYAGDASLRLAFPSFGLMVGYERVQPGFQSLGIAGIRSDQEAIVVQPEVRLWRQRVRLGARLGQTRNNLLAQRLATLRQQNVGLNARVQLSPRYAVTAAVTRLGSDNTPVRTDTASAAVAQGQQAYTVTVTPEATFRRGNTSHRLSLSANAQTLSVQAPAAPGAAQAGAADFTNLATTLAYALLLPGGRTVSLVGTYVRSDAQANTTQAMNLNAGFNTALRKRTLTLGVNAGGSRTQSTLVQSGLRQQATTLQAQASANVGYRLPFGDVVRLTLRSSATHRADQPSFREAQALVQFDHRF